MKKLNLHKIIFLMISIFQLNKDVISMEAPNRNSYSITSYNFPYIGYFIGYLPKIKYANNIAALYLSADFKENFKDLYVKDTVLLGGASKSLFYHTYPNILDPLIKRYGIEERNRDNGTISYKAFAIINRDRATNTLLGIEPNIFYAVMFHIIEDENGFLFHRGFKIINSDVFLKLLQFNGIRSENCGYHSDNLKEINCKIKEKMCNNHNNNNNNKLNIENFYGDITDITNNFISVEDNVRTESSIKLMTNTIDLINKYYDTNGLIDDLYGEFKTFYIPYTGEKIEYSTAVDFFTTKFGKIIKSEKVTEQSESQEYLCTSYELPGFIIEHKFNNLQEVVFKDTLLGYFITKSTQASNNFSNRITEKSFMINKNASQSEKNYALDRLNNEIFSNKKEKMNIDGIPGFKNQIVFLTESFIIIEDYNFNPYKVFVLDKNHIFTCL